MSCSIGHRCSLDPALLWLWCRLAATALIGPQNWELPYAVGVALKSNVYIYTHTYIHSLKVTLQPAIFTDNMEWVSH